MFYDMYPDWGPSRVMSEDALVMDPAARAATPWDDSTFRPDDN